MFSQMLLHVLTALPKEVWWSFVFLFVCLFVCVEAESCVQAMLWQCL